MSDSVRPHRGQPTRLPCPWDSPGKNTGVGCHFLLQCMRSQEIWLKIFGSELKKKKSSWKVEEKFLLTSKYYRKKEEKTTEVSKKKCATSTKLSRVPLLRVYHLLNFVPSVKGNNTSQKHQPLSLNLRLQSLIVKSGMQSFCHVCISQKLTQCLCTAYLELEWLLGNQKNTAPALTQLSV